MKRLLILAVLAVVAVSCMAQPADVDIVYSGMIPRVIIWDDVTEDIDGNPLLAPPDYEVWVALQSDFSDAASLGIVSVAQGTVDVSSLAAGYYYVGISTIIYDAEGNPVPSAIARSNDPLVVGPLGRFAYLVVKSPKQAQNLQTLP